MKLDPTIIKFVGPALSAIAAGWVMQATIRSSRTQAVRSPDGAFELRYPRWYVWVAGCVVLLGLIFMAGGAITSEGKMGLILLKLAVGGGMVAVGVWLTFEVQRRTLRVHVDRLEMIDLRGQLHRILWANLDGVRFRKFAGYLVLTGEGEVIQASVALIGLQSLVARLEASVPSTLWQQAVAELDEYRKRRVG